MIHEGCLEPQIYLDRKSALSKIDTGVTFGRREICETNGLNISGGCLNMKMSPYQYKDPHHINKTVSPSSYLYNGNHHTWKDDLYIETGLRLSEKNWYA